MTPNARANGVTDTASSGHVQPRMPKGWLARGVHQP